MKINVLSVDGKAGKEIATALFDAPLREDIVQKIAEMQKEKQPYAPFWLAGNQTSASGNVKHNRHVWKTDRGKGLGRFPKKRMADKGERFTWVAAVIPGVRGGRRAHPPKIEKRELKVNRKELALALSSAIAMTASPEMIKKKYSSVEKIDIKLPLIVEGKIMGMKAKNLFEGMEKMLGKELFQIAVKHKVQRAGKGKLRNRRYKSNSGMLIVTGKDEKMKASGFDIVNAKELKVKDLFANGARLTMFTEAAVKELEEKIKKIGGKA